MQKMLLFGFVLLLASLGSLPPACAQNMKVEVPDFFCSGEKYIIRFGVVNRFTYQRTCTVAFKIMDAKRVLACKEVTLVVPAESDGSALQEIEVNAPCVEGKATLEARIFIQTDRNRVQTWLSDCPRQ
ncbi:MAG: hypothetical protein JXL84_02590 [Deltaproteobacteria bacterium]|nr:hypothetical protein [Deltaproteobacteria bacterium]